MTNKSVAQRFQEKIKEPFDAHNDCFVWNANKNNGGYGKMSINGRSTYAHRVSYELFIGPISEGYHVDHLCGNRACVRPDHLQVLTAFENCGQANKGKAHCPSDHIFRYTYKGKRYCVNCHRESRRRYLARRKLIAT